MDLPWFFSIWVFLLQIFTIHRKAREGEATSLIPLYHFHLFHRQLGISLAITAEGSPIEISVDEEHIGHFYM